MFGMFGMLSTSLFTSRFFQTAMFIVRFAQAFRFVSLNLDLVK